MTKLLLLRLPSTSSVVARFTRTAEIEKCKLRPLNVPQTTQFHYNSCHCVHETIRNDGISALDERIPFENGNNKVDPDSEKC